MYKYKKKIGRGSGKIYIKKFNFYQRGIFHVGTAHESIVSERVKEREIV
jgi:hypothetical protein